MTIGDQPAPTHLALAWATPPTPAFHGSPSAEVAKKRERED
jgi:hypothetical protein